ncbi:MAG: hypothetical protein WCP21_23340 [Armatimonadota bacterium]
MVYLWVGIFWAMQAVAQLIFKYGGATPGRWVPCFIFGNVIGASSIWFLMLLYKQMNPNLALAIGTGGGFLAAQAALAVVFRVPLVPQQYVGAAAIILGMMLFALGTKA